MSSLLKLLKNNKLGRALLSVVLAVAVLCSTLSMVTLIPASAVSVWDGSIATSLTGSGTAGDPYLISNGSELALAITKGGSAYSYYKITEDIYLNDVSKINWSTGVADTGYTPNSWYEVWFINNRIENGTDFQGSIDGNGKVIYGLYYNENVADDKYSSYQEGAALIPRVKDGGNATILNLGMDNVYIDDNTTAAAFVAVAMNSSINIDSCYAGEKVTLKSANSGVFRGYGRNATGGSVTNSYSFATTVGTNSTGLVAFIWEKTVDQLVVSNCYNANGSVSTHSDPYYIATENNYESVAGGLTEGVKTLTADNMQGADVFTNSAKMPMLNSTGAFEAVENDYPILKVFKVETPDDEEDEEIVIWDGNTTTTPQGEGTENSPYLISNGAELAWAIANGATIGADKFYKLTDDIYLNDITKINWATGVADAGYEPRVWFDNTPFSGTIDGNGYVVYGLYCDINVTPSWGCLGAGLIPRVNLGKTVKITALGVDKSYVAGKNGASAFVGFAGSETNGANEDEVAANRANVIIDQCYVGAEVTLKGNAVGAFRGGTFGSNTTITNAYSLATLDTNGTAGLIGNHWNVTVAIENCYNANGAITLDLWNNAIDQAMKNVYATDKGLYVDKVVGLTADNMQGADVFTNASKMPNLNTSNAYEAVENGYPTLKVFNKSEGDGSGGNDDDDDDEPAGPTMPDGVVEWDGVTKTQPQGEGTQTSPYLISNGAELAWAIANGATVGADKFYKLTADIYLNDISKIDWTTGVADAGYEPRAWFDNASFSGTIDGNGHVVYGLYYNTDATTGWAIWGTGLVPKVDLGKSVSISNLGVENSYLSGKHGVSAFVGAAGDNVNSSDWSNVTINKCYVGSTVTLKGYDVGAFRGASRNSNTTIKNSYSLANIEADSAYGLVGSMWSVSLNIANCYIVGAGVTNEAWVAGVSNVYATSKGIYTGEVVELTAAQMKGANAFTNMPNLNADDAFVAQDNDYPVLKVFTNDQGGEEPGPGTGGEEPGPGTGGEEPGPTPDPTPVPDYVWDGKTQTAPVDSNNDGKYEITNGAELAWVVDNDGVINGVANNKFILTADIYLNDIDQINWETGAANAGYTPREWFRYWKYADNGRDVYHAFAGAIDGDGHTIYGLYYKNTSNSTYYDAAALLPAVTETAIIKDLAIDNAYINYTNGASAFVGFAKANSYVNISNSYAGADVTLIGDYAGVFRATAKMLQVLHSKTAIRLLLP